MVMRSTQKDTARRAQTHISRGTLRETDTKKYWNELTVDGMVSETSTGVEWIENYGSTSHPAKQDKDDNPQAQQQQPQTGGGPGGGGGGSGGEQGQQPKGDSAEVMIARINGSHSHPVVLAVGDRRHRLTELEEGDVANHRLQEDRQQFLMSKDGNYLSARSDTKINRIALVPPPQDSQMSQQQQANGAGAGTSGSGQQKKQKTYGQKSAKDDNKKSEINIEQNGSVTTSQHGDAYSAQKGGSDSSAYYKDRKQSAQATEDHVHIRFKDNRIFNDEMGNWCTSPILVKKDNYCKE
jgi:phage gp45-like